MTDISNLFFDDIRTLVQNHHLVAHVIRTLPDIALGFAFLVSGDTLVKSWRTLLLKSKLHRILLSTAKTDRILSEIIKSASLHVLSERELERASGFVEQAIKTNLPPKDQALLESGIRQPNRRGRERYLARILTAD